MYPYLAGETHIRQQRHELTAAAERHRLTHANPVGRQVSSRPRRSGKARFRHTWTWLLSRLGPDTGSPPDSCPPPGAALDPSLRRHWQ
jgi:hypothetical protein